jgi:hypothetical protein
LDLAQGTVLVSTLITMSCSDTVLCMSCNVSFLFIYLFIVYLMMVSVAQTIKSQMIE